MSGTVTVARIPNKKKGASKKGKLNIELGPCTAAEDREARERLVTARVALLIRNPFFGNLATRLTLKNADEWLTTAATDGRNFYYNAKFVNALDTKELEFLFGHEVLHVAYDHMGRMEDRNKTLSNIAADFAVNGDLVKHNIGRMITTVECLYDEKYVGWSYEQIYDDLLENCDEMTMDEYLDQLLDEHIKGENGEELSEAERQQIHDEFREAMLSAAKTESDPSKIPASVRQMIQDLTEPKIGWRELLPLTIQSAFKSDFTWMKSSRRGWHIDAILPGMDREKEIDIVMATDASGSCTTMLPDFFAEVRGVMEQFQSYRVHLFTFDTKVYNPQVFTPDNIADIEDYEVMGGGGTCFTPIWDYLKENDITPEKLVILTDMCASDNAWKSEENFCDTLWIVHTTKMEPPFGNFAFYEEV